jgi:hypothetical protein
MKLALALSLLAAPSASGFGMEHGDHNDAPVAPGGDEDTYERFDCQDFSQPEDAPNDMSDYCKEREGCYWQPFDAAGGFTTGYGYGGECLPGDESMVVMSCEESYGEAECMGNPKGCYYNPDDMSCNEDTYNDDTYVDPNKPNSCGEIIDEATCNAEDTFMMWFLTCAWDDVAFYCNEDHSDLLNTPDAGDSCDSSACSGAMFESECVMELEHEGCEWNGYATPPCGCPTVTGGDTGYGGNTYGSDTYGSDTYGSDTYGGNPNTYGSDTYGSDTHGSDSNDYV